MRLVIPGLSAFALALSVSVQAADAQLPPSIKKPIEAARKNVAATNAQSGAVTQAEGPPAPGAAPQAQGKAAAAPAGAKQAVARPAAAAPNARVVTPVAPAQDSAKVTFLREVFSYSSDDRRDPFASPFETGEIRPLIADLRVVGIIFDPTGRNSVAVMRDGSTEEQYRVKLGNILGRAKVTQIRQQEVVMTINEYGFSRQEILKLNVQQTKGKP